MASSLPTRIAVIVAVGLVSGALAMAALAQQASTGTVTSSTNTVTSSSGSANGSTGATSAGSGNQ